MALLSVSPATEGLDCNVGANWVTFDCAGEHLSKSSAMRMFDSAQMAFLTERTVRLTVDDTRKHSGWCLVQRIDVFSQIGSDRRAGLLVGQLDAVRVGTGPIVAATHPGARAHAARWIPVTSFSRSYGAEICRRARFRLARPFHITLAPLWQCPRDGSK